MLWLFYMEQRLDEVLLYTGGFQMKFNGKTLNFRVKIIIFSVLHKMTTTNLCNAYNDALGNYCWLLLTITVLYSIMYLCFLRKPYAKMQ